MTDRGTTTLDGVARRPGGDATPVRVNLDTDGFRVVADDRTTAAAYRDLATIAVQDATILLAIDDGPAPERIFLERFGQYAGLLVRELRERRLLQRLADGLTELPRDTPVELVEYAVADEDEHGVCQLVMHPWGAVLAPLDERMAVRRIRRGEIGRVETMPGSGSVRVTLRTPAGPAGAPAAGAVQRTQTFEIAHVGSAATRLAGAFTTLRDEATSDAARLVGALLADRPYAVRAAAIDHLVDGRPAGPAELGPDGFAAVEAAFLTEPVFAESHAALVGKAVGGAGRWLALAPDEPGGEQAVTWTFVELPGNLLALELLSAGAHATYCFRIVPRATHTGVRDPEATIAAVTALSDALIDARFLREPIALPADRLADPRYLRYRLALAALPSLAAARERFVARIVHDDVDKWSAALDDLVTWHGAMRDDAAIWPGRAGQESLIEQGESDAEGGGGTQAVTGAPTAVGVSGPPGVPGPPGAPDGPDQTDAGKRAWPRSSTTT